MVTKKPRKKKILLRRMNDKINKNTPAIFQRFQAQSQRNANIENGNTVNDSAQGKIWTSDISVADGYSVNYSASVSIILPAIQGSGKTWNYFITIDYDATLQAGGTNPGFFGSNLIKPNDNFIIGGQGHDWVKGFVNKIITISDTGGPPTYTYTYLLFVTIVDGDPLKVNANTSTFYWNRQIADSSENLDNLPPSEITFSYNPGTYETKLFWKDSNQNAKRHIVKIRDISTTDTLQLMYIKTYGNKMNFSGSLVPIVDANTTDISTVKIVDPGVDFVHPRRIEFIGEGSGSIFLATPYSFTGSLPIHEYEVIGVGVGANTISVKSKKTYPDWGWPTPVVSAYIEDLPGIAFSNYKVASVTQVNDNLFTVFLDYAENSGISVAIPIGWSTTVLNSTIKIHNGCQRVTVTGLPITTVFGDDKVDLPTNQYLSDWFIGSKIASSNFPANTYITGITKNQITFSAAGTTGSGATFDILGTGIGYTGKTRAKVQEINTGAQLHIDPVWEQWTKNDWLSRSEFAISIASTFDDLQKNTSQWSEEIYTKNIR